MTNKKTVTNEWLERMSLDVAMRTYYDDSDKHEPDLFCYPGVKKAIIKWLKEIGVNEE